MGDLGRWEEPVRRLILAITLVQAVGLWFAFHQGYLHASPVKHPEYYSSPQFYNWASWFFIAIAGIGLGTALYKPCVVTIILGAAFCAIAVPTLFAGIMSSQMQNRWYATALIAILFWGTMSRREQAQATS